MSTILEFQPRPASPTPLPHAVEAEIILFPGVRYEARGKDDRPHAATAHPKAVET